MRAIFRRLLFLNFPKIDDGPKILRRIMKKSNHDPPGVPKLNVRESDFDKRSLLLMQPNASGGSQSLSGGCFKPPSAGTYRSFLLRKV
jgi:hypothetical protein